LLTSARFILLEEDIEITSLAGHNKFTKEVKIMRKLVILSALIFSVSVFVYTQAHREYDPFTRQSIIQSNSAEEFYKRNSWEQPCLMVSIKFKGKYLLQNPIVDGIFVSSSGYWKYLKYHDLLFFADGESVKILSKAVHEGIVRRLSWDELPAGVSEYIPFKMEWKEFLKLANANKVEFKLGVNKFVLRPEEVSDLKAFTKEVLKILKLRR